MTSLCKILRHTPAPKTRPVTNNSIKIHIFQEYTSIIGPDKANNEKCK